MAEIKRFGTAAGGPAERALRADCAAMSSYTWTAEPALAVPITAMAGRLDSFTPLGGVRAWSRHTSAAFTFEVRSGGHHPTDDERAALISALRHRLGCPAVI
jgi:surfactin synthase thioesterase subunit